MVAEDPQRPLVVILGGAKVSEKVGVIERFLDFAEMILIGGAMAFCLFRARGIPTGDSLVEEEAVAAAEAILERAEGAKTSLRLPLDLVLADRFDARGKRREPDGIEVPDGWMALDIGPRTANSYAQLI